MPIKLEIFDRLDPGNNVYFMLAREMLGLSDAHATSGRVLGLLRPLRHDFCETVSGSQPAEVEPPAAR